MHWGRWRALGMLGGASLGLWATPCPAEDAIGYVKAATGLVTLQHRGTPQPAVAGTLLYEGDSLLTGADPAAVSVVMADDSRFALGAHSALVLREFRYNATTRAGTMQAELPGGNLTMRAGHLGAGGTPGGPSGAGLSVKTPRSVVRVQNAEMALHVKQSTKRAQ